MTETWRLFIAIELSEQIKSSLEKVLSSLRPGGEGRVRWVAVSNIHLTLKFLGEVPSYRVAELAQAMERASKGIPAFNLELGHTGAFPNLRQPRVLWIGVEGQLAISSQLQERLEEECQSLGFAREGRGFSPHLTLGRVREGTGDAIRGKLGQLVTSCRVEKANQQVVALSLMRSTLTPTGPLYTQLEQVSLEKLLPKEHS